ncbi:MFS transporter [Pseudomonas entomophila]|uniref:MFS transporter n=1 Tax=Pseudomonas entomophila TaxID=312306 RepID=UPI0023D88320|nr:MFS transporter [Pseudomonas entomophila]MDF0731382.1 MFS transporter [Pseudomonas entomophila]
MSLFSAIGLAPLRLLAIVLFAAIVPSVLMTAPVVATQYATQLGLGPARIGQLFSVELFAMSLATLPAYFWQVRWDWRQVARGAALLFILANLASAWSNDYGALLALRAVSALAGGTLMVICIASAAGSAQPDRVYGLWVSGQLILGALGLWLLPPLFASIGLKALYLSLALLMLLCLPLAGAFPPSAPIAPGNASRAAGAHRWLPGLCGLFAVLLFYIGLSAVWTFIGSIAGAAQIDPASSGLILSVATLLGIVGSIVATLIGPRWPRTVLLLLGYALMVGAVCLLLGTPDAARFALAALLFKYSWTFVLPFVLASLADRDHQGRLMNSVNLVIGGGLALGPVIAGPVLESPLGMSTVLLGSACCLLLSLVVLMPGQLRRPGVIHSLTTKGVS